MQEIHQEWYNYDSFKTEFPIIELLNLKIPPYYSLHLISEEDYKVYIKELFKEKYFIHALLLNYKQQESKKCICKILLNFFVYFYGNVFQGEIEFLNFIYSLLRYKNKEKLQNTDVFQSTMLVLSRAISKNLQDREIQELEDLQNQYLPEEKFQNILAIQQKANKGQQDTNLIDKFLEKSSLQQKLGQLQEQKSIKFRDSLLSSPLIESQRNREEVEMSDSLNQRNIFKDSAQYPNTTDYIQYQHNNSNNNFNNTQLSILEEKIDTYYTDQQQQISKLYEELITKIYNYFKDQQLQISQLYEEVNTLKKKLEQITNKQQQQQFYASTDYYLEECNECKDDELLIDDNYSELFTPKKYSVNDINKYPKSTSLHQLKDPQNQL